MAVSLVVDYDNRTVPTYLIPISDAVYQTTLSPSAVQSIAVPAGVRKCIIGWTRGNNIFTSINSASIALPGGTFDQSDAMMNVEGFNNLNEGDVLRFVSDATTYVSVAFYR